MPPPRHPEGDSTRSTKLRTPTVVRNAHRRRCRADPSNIRIIIVPGRKSLPFALSIRLFTVWCVVPDLFVSLYASFRSCLCLCVVLIFFFCSSSSSPLDRIYRSVPLSCCTGSFPLSLHVVSIRLFIMLYRIFSSLSTCHSDLVCVLRSTTFVFVFFLHLQPYLPIRPLIVSYRILFSLFRSCSSSSSYSYR